MSQENRLWLTDILGLQKNRMLFNQLNGRTTSTRNPPPARLHGGSDQLGKNLEWEIGKWHLAAGVAHRVQLPLFVADAGILGCESTGTSAS